MVNPLEHLPGNVMMKKIFNIIIFLLVALFLLLLLNNCKQQNKKTTEAYPLVEGEYIGQEKPGLTPELFAPGILSTRHYENSITFSPNGKEIYFAIAAPRNFFVILFMKHENNRWKKPQVAPFSGKYKDGFPFFAPGGKRIYFCSCRPLSNTKEHKKDWDIWVVDKTNPGWSEPQNLGFPVNSDSNDKSPTVTGDGTLYFSRSKKGSADIYRSKFVNGKYMQPEKLSDSINSPCYETHPYIAPDESYIIFSSYERPDGFGKADIYISFRKEDGSWTRSENMGKKMNTRTHENCAIISPDGKFLFFCSYRRTPYKTYWKKTLTYDEVLAKIETLDNYYPDGCPNFYWVDSKIIEQFKTTYVEQEKKNKRKEEIE